MTDSNLIEWFGYPYVENSVMAWGARAIFKNSFLDLLPNRQGHYNSLQPQVYLRFIARLNAVILPELRKIADGFNESDKDKFVAHFDWTEDQELVCVAQGSPNQSYGYFYLSVSLVKREFAPAVLLSPQQQYEENRKQREAAQQVELARRKGLDKQHNASRRKIKLDAKTEINKKLETAQEKVAGQTLGVGDRLLVDANQATRIAFVLAVVDNEALIEYYMPAGKKFLRIVNAISHGMIRNVSHKSLPMKWRELITESV